MIMDVIIKHLLPISYLFSGLLVALFAIYAFNIPPYSYEQDRDNEKTSGNEPDEYSVWAEPSLPKYMTEKSRYNFFLAIFVMISIGLYTLLGALLPNEVASIVGFDQPRAANFFIASLIIIGITGLGTTRYDWVKYLLIGPIRHWIHKYAKIPTKGRNLFYVLSNSDINYKGLIGKQYVEDILHKDYSGGGQARQDLTLDDFSVGNRDTIAWKWARLAFCMNFIEEGSKEGAFKTQLDEASLGWHPIHTEYQKTISSVIKQKNNALNDDEQIALNDRLRKLLASTYRLISCLLLMVSRPDEDPVKKLKNVGFDVTPEHRYIIPSKEVVRVVASVFLSIVVLSTVANIFTPITFTNQLVYIASAFAILIMPIVVVIAMKKHLCPSGIWPIATPDKDYDRPVLVYLATAFIAWFITTALMILLGTVLIKLEYSGIDGEKLYLNMLLYSSLSVLTALFAAYRIDIPRRVFSFKASHIAWRMGGGAVQGLAMALLLWMCLMIDLHGGQIYPTAELSTEAWSELILYEVLAFATGFAIFVSLFFRKHLTEQRHEKRKPVSTQVQAIINGVTQMVTLKNISKGGAAFRLAENSILQDGTLVELLLDSQTTRSGVVVSETDGVMHLSNIYG
jgi:hypothetical protein